ncbi:hypothetical protein EDB87DRAFT_1579119 [Lactarius vividus]|nr:hypothetical protein EDB87DRAFT_1579119 [Lactarius vividus]
MGTDLGNATALALALATAVRGTLTERDPRPVLPRTAKGGDASPSAAAARPPTRELHELIVPSWVPTVRRMVPPGSGLPCPLSSLGVKRRTSIVKGACGVPGALWTIFRNQPT